MSLINFIFFIPQLIGKMNGSLALVEGVPLGDAMGELVDSETLAFENALIEVPSHYTFPSSGC